GPPSWRRSCRHQRWIRPMKLTDTQLVLLSRASQRPDQCAEIPANLKGGSAQKFVAKLISGGLVEEIRGEVDMPVWRRGDDGPLALRLTDAGLSAISADEPAAPPGKGAAAPAPMKATPSPAKPKLARKRSDSKTKDRPTAKSGKSTATPKASSKQD